MGTKEVHVARLGEARKALQEARFLLIVSTLEILVNLGKDENSLKNAGSWFNVWITAFRTQERLTLDNIVPAKNALGLPRTNKAVEREVINASHQISKSLGVNSKFGEGTVLFHIEEAKRLQKQEGITDSPLSNKGAKRESKYGGKKMRPSRVA